MPQDHWLGYKGGGSLCVFHNTVPNNTLPLIWYDKDGAGWAPLSQPEASKANLGTK
jgi:hypothetical protein